MPWPVVWTRSALRDMQRLDRSVAARVREAIERFASSGHGDVKKLRGDGGRWRLRVGDWRVTFRYESDVQAITVLGVGPRGGAYRR